ncbi:unnamed protein product [Penicillium glandicola]
MKRIKRTARRIRAGPAAKRQPIREKGMATGDCIKGRLSAMRESIQAKVSAICKPNKEKASIPASEDPDAIALVTVSNNSDQVDEIITTSQKVTRLYSDTPLYFIIPSASHTFKEMIWLQFGREWASFEDRFLDDMRRYPTEDNVDPYNSRAFNELPLLIRAKIWKGLCKDGKEPIFLRNNGMTPRIPISMHFVSFHWMSETWLAYINALSNRTLVVMDFPRHAYLAPPFPIFQQLATTRVRAIKIALGDKDPEKAERRNREFVRFMLKQRNGGLLAVHTLIIELKKNWMTGPHFTEMHLADLLTCGAFAHIERLRIHGRITRERLNRLLKRTEQRAQAAIR